MCVVSLYYSINEKDFILTHNRDEDNRRKSSNKVESRELFGEKFVGPVDELSGGTWIYYSEQYVVCILNGAYEHKAPQVGEYRMSRGKLILELLKYRSIDAFVEDINLESIAFFTMLMIDITSNERKILVWDEKDKFVEDISNEKLVVRSSSTLYDNETKEKHTRFLNKIERVTSEEFKKYHKQLMIVESEKCQFLQTTSISQVIFENMQINLLYCPTIE